MAPHSHDMQLRAAAAVAVATLVAATLMLWAADEPTDLLALVGAAGLVVGGALLGLTVLASRWAADPAFDVTRMDADVREDERGATQDRRATDDRGSAEAV